MLIFDKECMLWIKIQYIYSWLLQRQDYLKSLINILFFNFDFQDQKKNKTDQTLIKGVQKIKKVYI